MDTFCNQILYSLLSLDVCRELQAHILFFNIFWKQIPFKGRADNPHAVISGVEGRPPYRVCVSLSGGGNLCGPVGGTALTAQWICHDGLQAPEDNANQTLKCPSQISLLLFNSPAHIPLSLGPEVPIFRAEWVWCSPAAACVPRGWQTGEPRVFCVFKELFGSAVFPLLILLYNFTT